MDCCCRVGKLLLKEDQDSDLAAIERDIDQQIQSNPLYQR